jgi:hypothetical protein
MILLTSAADKLSHCDEKPPQGNGSPVCSTAAAFYSMVRESHSGRYGFRTFLNQSSSREIRIRMPLSENRKDIGNI